MAKSALSAPIDQYERLRRENQEEEQRRLESYRQQQALAQAAAEQQRAEQERQEFQRDHAFFAGRLPNLVPRRRPAALLPQPTQEETDRRNRLYWYNLMYR